MNEDCELRELTNEEVLLVSGSAGTPTVNYTAIDGGYQWTATCGAGYSIYEPFNPATTGPSTWENSLNYGCSVGESGVQYYSFQTYNNGGGDWEGATYWGGS